MRHVVAMLALVGLLISSVPAVSVTAQDSSLRDLLPTADDIGPGFVAIDNRTRTLAEQATGFANANEAARLLAGWNWQENAFAVFQAAELTAAGSPLATLDISLTRFADAEDASLAMPYFLQDRAAVLGHREMKQVSQPALGDESRVLNGSVEDGYDTTLYVRSGALLMRISLTATSVAGGTAPSLQQIAQGIIDRAAPRSPSSTITVMQPAVEPMLTTLPLDHAACFSIESEGELDVPAVVERLATGADVSTSLQALGWQGGVYRQFTCKPPAGRVGWVDISLHRFADVRAAAEAVAYFADSRGRSMDLQPIPAPTFGDSSAALTGSAINGTEYSLYMSSGSLLFAVTGVAPDSGSDPRADVEAIAAALLAPNRPVQVAEIPTATSFVPIAAPPTVTPIPTATPLPTLVPIPVPTATPISPPTATPLPTAAPPMLVVLPTATPTATAPPPPPTALPTPEATAIPAADETAATTGPLPTPTPRVIRPPTPAAG
jgi:hypothetical protein